MDGYSGDVRGDAQMDEMDEIAAETILAVYTIVVRVPRDIGTGWSVRALETKGGYFDDIVASDVLELRGSADLSWIP